MKPDTQETLVGAIAKLPVTIPRPIRIIGPPLRYQWITYSTTAVNARTPTPEKSKAVNP